MESIIVGFSKPKGWFYPMSWIIRWAEGTAFSHAYIRVRSESLDRDLVYQATGAGVYFIGLPAFKDHYEIVEEYALTVSEEGKKKLLRWAVDNSGKPYGRLQCLGIGLRRLALIIGIRIKNPFSNEGEAYVCTELCAQATVEAGIPFNVEKDDVGLKELVQHVRVVAAL